MAINCLSQGNTHYWFGFSCQNKMNFRYGYCELLPIVVEVSIISIISFRLMS